MAACPSPLLDEAMDIIQKVMALDDGKVVFERAEAAASALKPRGNSLAGGGVKFKRRATKNPGLTHVTTDVSDETRSGSVARS
jgi:hypothetical protein